MRSDVKAMQLFVDSMVGLPKFSYPANTNAPRPNNDGDLEFATIKLIEEYPVGLPVKTVNNETATSIEYLVRAASRLRFRIVVVDTDGVASYKIAHGWTTEAMKGLMMTTGYGYIKCNPISNEDAKLEKKWELRQGFSVEVYVERSFIETVDFISGMTIQGEFITDTLDSLLTTIQINEP